MWEEISLKDFRNKVRISRLGYLLHRWGFRLNLVIEIQTKSS